MSILAKLKALVAEEDGAPEMPSEPQAAPPAEPQAAPAAKPVTTPPDAAIPLSESKVMAMSNADVIKNWDDVVGFIVMQG